MDTRHLKAFLKIAETGSISRAAKSLGIAQPSLGQQLLRLEDEVGVALFRRTARGVTLTEAGRVFQEHARELLRDGERALEDVRQLSSEPAGEVLLAVPYAISRMAGLALIRAFAARAPRVRMRLIEATTGAILGWLEAGKVDLGVLHDLGHWRNLAKRRVAAEDLLLVGPAGRFGPLAQPQPVSARELGALPLILPGMPHGLRQTIEHEAARLGGAVHPVLEIDAMAHVTALVAAGEGLAILPRSALVGDPVAAGLSFARIVGPDGKGQARRVLCLARNRGEVVSHASIVAEDLVVEVLTRLIAEGLWQAEPLAG